MATEKDVEAQEMIQPQSSITDNQPLLNNSFNTKPLSKPWNNRQIICILIITIIITAILSNIDRIITALENSSSNDLLNKYDSIIVGAGPSGLLQAHLLMKEYPNKQILLIEKNDRVGGRSFSLKLQYKNQYKIHIENCAMRFYWRQEYINKILYHLDLCDDIIPFSNTNESRHDPIYSFRNQIIRKSQFDNNGINNIYNLTVFDQSLIENITFPNLLSNAYDYGMKKILLENNASIPNSESEWKIFRNNFTFMGIKLYKWSFWNFLRSLDLSVEYYQSIKDSALSAQNEASAAYILYRHYYYYYAQNRVRDYSSYSAVTLKKGYDTI